MGSTIYHSPARFGKELHSRGKVKQMIRFATVHVKIQDFSRETNYSYMNIEVKGSGVVGLTDCNAFEAEY